MLGPPGATGIAAWTGVAKPQANVREIGFFLILLPQLRSRLALTLGPETVDDAHCAISTAAGARAGFKSFASTSRR